MPRYEITTSLNRARTQPVDAASKVVYFLQCVLPAIEDHWLRHSIALTYLESVYDSLDEFEDIGCGHLAFAVLAGIPACELETFFPGSADRLWVNRVEMERALRRFGWEFMKTANRWPNIGLCFVHWCGPWTDRAYPHGILKRGHWVAVLGEYVFDANWRGWLPKENWEDIIVADLLRNHAHARGWTPLTAYELCLSGINKAA